MGNPSSLAVGGGINLYVLRRIITPGCSYDGNNKHSTNNPHNSNNLSNKKHG